MMAQSSGQHSPWNVQDFVKVNIPRMVQEGIWYDDLLFMAANTKSMDFWTQDFMTFARRYESVAEEALSRGFKTTAAEGFLRTSLYYHFSQTVEFFDFVLKEKAIRGRVESYKKAAGLFQPPAERIELPFQGVRIPGYLWPPKNTSIDRRPGCVLIFGGLDSTKEEMHSFGEICHNRGLATFLLDGPGQGEVNSQMKARPDFDAATSAIIDYLQTRKEIDPERIGVVGRSAGGYYAARSAADDSRIKACVVWGAFYDFSHWDTVPTPSTRLGFMWASGKTNLDEAKEYSKLFTMEGIANKIRCPIYILHGKQDTLVPLRHATLLASQVQGEKILDIEENGDHCAINMGNVVKPRMADWLTTKLN
jgi:2,6-dihydroxypseudooxynicotine hydrolase